MKKRFLLFALLSLMMTQVKSQDSLELSVTADVASRYIWRGMQLGSSVAIQPTLQLSYKGFSIGSWASYSVNREIVQEADLYLTYKYKKVSFTLFDYYNPIDTLFTGDYFRLGNKTTRHTVEGIITVDGTESLPFQLVIGSFFYGNDRDVITNKNIYSTYIELNYNLQIKDNLLKPFIGVSPWTGYYSNNGLQVVNLGVTGAKTIKVTDGFDLPIKVSFITNPHKQNVFLVFLLTF